MSIDHALCPVQPRDEPAIEAILKARWGSLPIKELPGGLWQAKRLVKTGWGKIWEGLRAGDRITLTSLAASYLHAELDDEGTIKRKDELEYNGRRIVCERDEATGGFTVTLEDKPLVRRSTRQLEESSRWYLPGQERPPRRMPKVRGFVPLPFAEKVAALAHDDEPPAQMKVPVQLVIMNRIAGYLKPRVKSAKRAKRTPRAVAIYTREECA